jgi:uncharacterized protein (DUF4415 family)
MNKDDFASMMRGMEQAQAHLAGEAVEGAVTHTAQEIAVRRKAGRPAGSVKANRKEQVALRLDPEVVAYFRSTGAGWQSRINEALRRMMEG